METKDKKTKRQTPTKVKSLVNSYKYYRTQGGTMNSRTHAKAIDHYCKHLVEQVQDGKAIYIPNIGEFQVKGSKARSEKPKGSNINWPETNKLWAEYPELKGVQYVRYLNEHTGGWWYKLCWKPGLTALIRAYKMKPVEHFKKSLSKRIINGADYISAKSR